MITSGRNTITLSTGAQLTTTSLSPFVIGELDPSRPGRSRPVDQGMVYGDDEAGPRALTPAERQELAEYMAARWLDWATGTPTLPGAICGRPLPDGLPPCNNDFFHKGACGWTSEREPVQR